MPLGLLEFPHGAVCLEIGDVAEGVLVFHLQEIVGALPPFIHEILGQIQVFPFSGGLVKADQGQFDFLMAGVAPFLPLSPPEDGGDVVRIAAHDLQEAGLPQHFISGHGRLHEVAGAVEFVLDAQVAPPLLRLHGGEVGVQVSVGLLGGGNALHDAVVFRLQFGIGGEGQGVGHPLQHLRHVGIPVDVWLVGLALLPVQVEGRQSAGGTALLQGGGDGDGQGLADPGGKHAVVEFNLGDGDALVGGKAHGAGMARKGKEEEEGRGRHLGKILPSPAGAGKGEALSPAAKRGGPPREKGSGSFRSNRETMLFRNAPYCKNHMDF